jgi:hypothetical protein
VVEPVLVTLMEKGEEVGRNGQRSGCVTVERSHWEMREEMVKVVLDWGRMEALWGRIVSGRWKRRIFAARLT